VAKQFNSFEEFWPYYVKAHSKKLNRTLHFIGTSVAMGCVALSVIKGKKWLLRAPLLAYPIAWTGHFLVEGNTPATFGHPAWSLQADLLMWYKTLSGTMDSEVDRVLREQETEAAAPITTPVDPSLN
jgi:hypothetical protein